MNNGTARRGKEFKDATIRWIITLMGIFWTRRYNAAGTPILTAIGKPMVRRTRKSPTIMPPFIFQPPY
jgi:hypothetical protein